jgi:hypothetical protein
MPVPGRREEGQIGWGWLEKNWSSDLQEVLFLAEGMQKGGDLPPERRADSGVGRELGLGQAVLTGDSYGAIETEAAIRALEMFSAQVVPELVLPAATHCVLVHGTRRNLHLGHFW